MGKRRARWWRQRPPWWPVPTAGILAGAGWLSFVLTVEVGWWLPLLGFAVVGGGIAALVVEIQDLRDQVAETSPPAHMEDEELAELLGEAGRG